MKTATLLLAAFLITPLIALAALFLQPPNPPLPTWLSVGTESSLPAGGMPDLRPVMMERRDGWRRWSDSVGQVSVRVKPETGEVIALTPYHGHLRVPVLYDADQKIFVSRCWTECTYDLDGRCRERRVVGGHMHRLETKVVGGEIFVRASSLNEVDE